MNSLARASFFVQPTRFELVIDAQGRLDLAATARLRKGNASADTI